MTGLNYKVKIIDNFLSNEDYKDLCNLNLGKNFDNEFQIYHNMINNDGIIKCTIDEKLLKEFIKITFQKQ